MRLLAATLAISLATISLPVALVACGPAANPGSTTPSSSYSLTYTAADAEHILSWQTIISQCPELGNDEVEAFVHRGETIDIGPGESVSLEASSPAAWADARIVRDPAQGQVFNRSFGVEIMFFDASDYLDEYLQSLQSSGVSFQHDGDFVTAAIQGTGQGQSLQVLLAGKQFAISFTEFAAAGESLFCTQEDLANLFPAAMANISSVEITTPPPGFPQRSS